MRNATRLFIILTFILNSSLLASIGKVSLLKGEAFAQRDAGTIALQDASPIEEKDIIVTSKNSKIQLIFEDKTVITLGGESQFKIEEYLNTPSNPKAKFKFGQGTFKSITGNIGKVAPENFTLETKTATIGIRGTTVGIISTQQIPNLPPLPDNIFCLSGQIAVGALQSPAPPVIVRGGSWTQILPPTEAGVPPPPPSPPVPFTPQDLNQFNQGLGGGAPPPPPTGGLGEPQPSGNNTPPTNNPPVDDTSPSGGGAPSGGGTGEGAPTPQSFTPAAASSAAQTNTQNAAQSQIIQEVADDLGIPAGDLQDQIIYFALHNTCPPGTSGTYPNCVAQSCPANTVGVYPNCVLTCPAGTTGPYPNCGTCTALQSGTYPNCVDLTCPAGQSGTYPNCGTCTALQSGTYPNCVDLTCPSGTTGTYPDCTTITTGGGGSTPPSVNLDFVGLATSSAVQSNTIQHTHDNAFTAFVTNALAEGEITLTDNALAFSSSSVSATSPTLFTVNISDANITQLSSVSSPASNVLWGKWTSLEMDGNSTLMPTSDNYWVAGKIADRATAASHIASIYNDASTYTTYTYLGKSMGTVYNSSGQPFAIINDATNEVKLVFQFGNSGAPINNAESHVQFTANSYWNIGFYPGQAHASADGSFWAMFSSGTIDGDMKGAFYGANAESLGGTFKANNFDTYSTAVGAFVANKSGTTTSIPLSGFATSINNNLFNGEVIGKSYHNEDTVNFLFTDSSYIGSGIITLDRAPSDPPIEEQIMSSSTTSVSTFGSSSDYLRWGKWTSSAVGDDNETLIASADNFWVAGTNQTEAASYINDLVIGTQTPILTYKGNVIGSTYKSGTRYAIDEDTLTNKVQFQFNLGASFPIDTANSFITFASNGGTWLLKPDSADAYFGDDGTFSSSFTSGSTSGDSSSIINSSLNGTFYGPSANAAGGTFQASDSDDINIALGVFKTIKTSEFYYPTSFSPALDDTDGISAIGTFNIIGFATSDYFVGSNRIASTGDGLSLTIDTTTPTISGDITFADGRGSISLGVVSGDVDKMTFLDNNHFSIKDFDDSQGYIVTDSSEPNDYVSWGYWAINSQDTSQLTNKRNYWVGGSQTDADAAISYIAGLSPSTYIYTGKVMGDVEEAGSFYNIANDASNSVQLKFDFGGGTNSIFNDSSYSWIRFTANNQQWDLRPALIVPTVTNGIFNDGLMGTVASTTSVTSGAIQGKFYGDQAQAVGGTFNAATAAAKAVGVFKAVR